MVSLYFISYGAEPRLVHISVVYLRRYFETVLPYVCLTLTLFLLLYVILFSGICDDKKRYVMEHPIYMLHFVADLTLQSTPEMGANSTKKS